MKQARLRLDSRTRCIRRNSRVRSCTAEWEIRSWLSSQALLRIKKRVLRDVQPSVCLALLARVPDRTLGRCAEFWFLHHQPLLVPEALEHGRDQPSPKDLGGIDESTDLSRDR